MSRGRAFNIWKTQTKYISRLKENLHNWRIVDGEAVNRLGMTVPNWRRPLDWKELDQKNKGAKAMRKTVNHYRDLWKQFEKHQTIKKKRQERKQYFGTEEEM